VPRAHQRGAARTWKLEVPLVQELAERDLVKFVEGSPGPPLLVDVLSGRQHAGPPVIGQFVQVGL